MTVDGVDHSLDSTLMSDAFRLMVHYAFLVILSKGWNQGMTRLWLVIRYIHGLDEIGEL